MPLIGNGLAPLLQVIQQQPPPSFITCETAEQHGLPRNLFRRLCRAGLPHRVEGGVKIALRSDVEAWLRANPSASGAPSPEAPHRRDMIAAKLAASGLRPGGQR